MSAKTMPNKEITLKNDHGSNINFRGALYAQTSFFEEDTGILTKQELYSTEEGHQAFCLISSDGDLKERSAYLVKREGDMCKMSNGEKEINLPYEWLMMYTQALWDIDLEHQRKQQVSDADTLSVNE